MYSSYVQVCPKMYKKKIIILYYKILKYIIVTDNPV